MNEKIILRREIRLSSIQEKMVRSGWGNDVIDSTAVEAITYLSDGLKVNGYLAYPKSADKKYPCIIWCRGGIGNTGAIDEFNAKGMFGQIASWGYVVFASQYRGNAGSEGIDEFGGKDINDVLNLIPLADEIDCADKNVWGIEGWSRGGMMTYLSLTKTNLFKAAITLGGIANLKNVSENNLIMKRIFEYGIGKETQNNFEENFYSRSIVNYPDKLCKTTPLLLIHGTEDDRIPASDSIELANKLKQINHPHELVLLEGGDHFLKSHRSELNTIRKNWLQKYLK